MPNAFSRKLGTLSHRVEQVLGYQEVSSPGPEAMISHFTLWEGAQAMLAVARSVPAGSTISGLKLWAGDSNCLNDPLEGKELLRFAEAAVESSRLGPDLQPVYVTGQWPRYPIGNDANDTADTLDTPHVPEGEWSKLAEILATLYRLPPLQIAGSTAPQTVASRVHLVSFCREKDRLDLWRTYGKEGSGVCMAMPLQNALASVTDPGWRFFNVAYDDRSKARAWALIVGPLYDIHKTIVAERDSRRKNLYIDQTLDALHPLLYLFKHEQYRSEREVRLLYSGPTVPTVVLEGTKAVVETQPFFLGGGGCSVILGPKMEHRNSRAAVLSAELRNAFGAAAPIVQLSKVPYQ